VLDPLQEELCASECLFYVMIDRSQQVRTCFKHGAGLVSQSDLLFLLTKVMIEPYPGLILFHLLLLDGQCAWSFTGKGNRGSFEETTGNQCFTTELDGFAVLGRSLVIDLFVF
jgi:hypothetical protein